jgi:hypothetical protein
VATAIVAVALVPSLTMIVQGTRGVDTAGRRILMGQLASLLLEDLRIRPPDEVVSRDWTSVLADPDSEGPFAALVNLSDDASGLFGLADPRFMSLHSRLQTVSYRLDVVDDSPCPGLRAANLTMRDSMPHRTVSWSFSTVLPGDAVSP